MQFNGIGRSEHGADVHHVTNCMHDHPHFKKEGDISAASAGRSTQMSAAVEQQPEGQLSLSAWLDRTLGNGKRLLKGIWGTSETAAVREAGERSGKEQLLAQMGDTREADSVGTNAAGQEGHRKDLPHSIRTAAQIAQSSVAVPPLRTEQEAPGISAAKEVGGGRDTLWQEVRVKFKDMAGQLRGHLPGNFFSPQTRNFFQMKQEQSKEDPRRQGKARRDAVEIDSYLMDESYLLDSYDRTGSYSRLTTKK